MFRREYSQARVRVSKLVSRDCTSGVYSEGSELMRIMEMKGSDIFILGVDDKLLNR